MRTLQGTCSVRVLLLKATNALKDSTGTEVPEG